MSSPTRLVIKTHVCVSRIIDAVSTHFDDSMTNGLNPVYTLIILIKPAPSNAFISGSSPTTSGQSSDSSLQLQNLARYR